MSLYSSTKVVFRSTLSREQIKDVQHFIKQNEHDHYLPLEYFLSLKKSSIIYFLAYRDNTLNGIAIFSYIPKFLFPARLLCDAYFTDSFFYTEDQYIENTLLKAIHNYAQDQKISFVEIKNKTLQLMNGLIAKENIYASFEKDLPSDQKLLLHSIPRKKRADIRKALNNNALIFHENIPFNDFYNIYTQAQRDLGTPTHARSFYKRITDHSHYLLSGVSYKGNIIAVCLSFIMKDRILAYYGGALEQARPLHAFDLMYYYLMCWGIRNQKTYFDFGRSKYNTGSFAYKTYWGIQPKARHHIFMTIDGQDLPDTTPKNKTFQTRIKMWKKMPLWLTRLVGPFIIKYIG